METKATGSGIVLAEVAPCCDNLTHENLHDLVTALHLPPCFDSTLSFSARPRFGLDGMFRVASLVF
jgi:hypothetical protein